MVRRDRALPVPEGAAPSKVCPECDSILAAAVRHCPDCGYAFPPPEVKVKATAETRGQLIEIIGLFGAKAVDLTAEVITVEATGSPAKLAALLQLFEPYGIRELVQSGLVALGRGNRSLTDRNQRTERLKAVRTG